MKELGVPMDELRKARKEDKEFVQKEKDANALYQDILLEEITEYVEEFPAFKVKIAERLIDRLKPETAKTTVNINNTEQSVNLIGLTEQETYNDTKKLLDYVAGKQKSIQSISQPQLVDAVPVE